MFILLNCDKAKKCNRITTYLRYNKRANRVIYRNWVGKMISSYASQKPENPVL